MTQKSTFLILLAPFFISCASNQNMDNLIAKQQTIETRVVALEQDRFKVTQDLQQENAKLKTLVTNELKSFRSAQIQQLNQLDEITKDIEEGTNQQELSARKLQGIQRDIRNLKKVLGRQIAGMEKLQEFFTQSIDTPTSKAQDDQQKFNQAVTFYKKKQFQQAAQQFAQLRQEHPKSELADDSLFYIAYMQLLQEDYDSASLRFFELLEFHPQSNRVHETKWWLANSLENLGDLNSALDLYKQLKESKEKNPYQNKAEQRLADLKS